MIAPLLKSLLRKDRARSQAETLFAALSAQARAPEFYLSAGAPDTAEGRFEVLSLHMALVVDRLRVEGAPLERLTARLQEAFFESLDNALREMGVGDLSVGRKMRGLAEAFYGRYGAYRAGLATDGDALEAAIARNMLSSDQPEIARSLAAYARQARDALAAAPIEALEEAIAELRTVSRAAFKEGVSS